MPEEFKDFKISKGYRGYTTPTHLEFGCYEPYENYQKLYVALKKRIKKRT